MGKRREGAEDGDRRKKDADAVGGQMGSQFSESVLRQGEEGDGGAAEQGGVGGGGGIAESEGEEIGVDVVRAQRLVFETGPGFVQQVFVSPDDALGFPGGAGGEHEGGGIGAGAGFSREGGGGGNGEFAIGVDLAEAVGRFPRERERGRVGDNRARVGRGEQSAQSGGWLIRGGDEVDIAVAQGAEHGEERGAGVAGQQGDRAAEIRVGKTGGHGAGEGGEVPVGERFGAVGNRDGVGPGGGDAVEASDEGGVEVVGGPGG